MSLEGEIRRPETPPSGSAVICHAHPRHGGSKDHPILWALRNDLASRGFVVLAFNFRGTMRSAGTYGAGHAETKDVVAAIGRVREDAAGPTLVCGWSFGANVALREALTDDRVGALALIGLPLEPGDVEIPRRLDRPSSGPSRVPPCCSRARGTSTAPGRALESLARTMPKAEVVIVPGTDHFLWRREKAVAETVGSFAARTLLSGTAARAAGPAPPPDASHHDEREEQEREPEQPWEREHPDEHEHHRQPDPHARLPHHGRSGPPGERADRPRRTRTRGAGSTPGAHRHPGYGPGTVGRVRRAARPRTRRPRARGPRRTRRGRTPSRAG